MKKKANVLKTKKTGAVAKSAKPTKKVKKSAFKAKKSISATRKLLSGESAPSKFMKPTEAFDPALSKGHRKLNVKDNFTEASGAKTHVQRSAISANSDKVRRNTSNHRRIITGATLGKTGRIVET